MKALGAALFCLGLHAHAGTNLGELTWPEAQSAISKADVVIIPIGAGAKEHGRHLPMNTDRIVLEHLIEAAVESANVVAVPPILHGWFPAFRQYPGTEVANPEVFQNYIREVALSVIRHGAQRVVFLNTGITLATGLPIAVVARDLRADLGVPTLVVSWDNLETEEAAALAEQLRGGHADEIETSIMLHLRPDLVHMDRAEKDYRGEQLEQIGYAPGLFERGPTDGPEPPGVFGDPTLARASKGEKVLNIMTRNWLKALQQFVANAEPASGSALTKP